MVPPRGRIFFADLHHYPRLRPLCQVCHLTFHVSDVLTQAVSSTLKGHKFERSQLSRFTIQKLEASPVTLCCFACFSCIPPPITRFVSNLSRPSGTLIISSSHSFSDFTPM